MQLPNKMLISSFFVLNLAFLGTGSKVVKIENKIVGGETANPCPYMVAIEITKILACGGAIISRSAVVTAAHCCTYPEPYIRLRVGSRYKLKKGYLHKVAKMIRHENYIAAKTQNDIAIIIPEPFFTFSATVQPIPLTTSDFFPEPDEDVDLTGWGRTSEGGNTSEIILQATVPIVTREYCESVYGSKITDSMFCAGRPEGGVDSCQGDSGGPVVWYGFLVGVVSWGTGCARPGYPGVYTDIGYFLGWIEEKAGLSSNLNRRKNRLLNAPLVSNKKIPALVSID